MNERDVKVFRPLDLNELDRVSAGVEVPPAYIAGGTDLLLRPERWQKAPALVNLGSVAEVATLLEIGEKGLRVGAAVPMSLLIRDSRVRDIYPLLAEALAQIGSVQIQNRATLGGNIANASPAGDSLPVLSVYDAMLWLGPCVQGEFTAAKITDVMRGPGMTALNGRYIASIELPLPEREGQFRYFRKVGQRYSLAISKLSLAVLGWCEQGVVRDIRICAGSVSPVVKRAEKTEAQLRGKALTDERIAAAAQCLSDEITPITDIRSTDSYRRRICGAVLCDALHAAREAQ